MNRWWQAAAFFAVVGPANAADLSLQRVMLSSGGVGYFEYEATVDGNATLNLDVPIDTRSTTFSKVLSSMTRAAPPARSPCPAANR
jgi:hypothetical protein